MLKPILFLSLIVSIIFNAIFLSVGKEEPRWTGGDRELKNTLSLYDRKSNFDYSSDASSASKKLTGLSDFTVDNPGVTFKNGFWRVDVKSTPLLDVLDKLKEMSGIKMTVSGISNEKILRNIHLESNALEVVVSRLLDEEGMSAYYTKGVLSAINVYSDEYADSSSESFPPASDKSRLALHDCTSEELGESPITNLHATVARADRDLAKTLIGESLFAANDDLRVNGILMAEQYGIGIDYEDLIAMIETDPSAQAREIAAEYFFKSEGIKDALKHEVAKSLSEYSSKEVQEKAKEYLAFQKKHRFESSQMNMPSQANEH